MRKEAERDIVKPEICHLEESAEPEVKKYFKVVEKSDKAGSESENSDKSRDSSPTPSTVVATASTKGQLISNCPFGVFKSPKEPTISALASKNFFDLTFF